MATVYNPILDEEKQQNSQINQPEDQATPTAPAAGASSSSIPNSAGSAGITNKPSKSGQFTNLQNYIQANKQGAQKLGQDVANKVGAKVQSGLSGLEAGKQTAINEASTTANTLKEQQQAGQQAVQSIISGQQTEDLGGLEQTAAKGLSEQYKTDLQNTQFKDLANFQNKGIELKELGDQTKTSDGRQAILQRNFARPDYTRGQTTFDSLLLGGSKEAQQGLSAARREVGKYNPNLQAAQEQFGQIKTGALGQLDSGMANLKSKIAEATYRGEDASAEKSLYAKLAKEAADFNAGQSAQTAAIDNQDALDSLNNAGYAVTSLNDTVTIPGTNIKVTARELAKNPQFFQESFQSADVRNIDAKALARLNVLNRLGNMDELTPTQALNRDIQRSMSSQGTNAINATQAALQAKGLMNLDAWDATGRGVTGDNLQSIADGGIESAGIRGEATAILRNLESMPDEQLAQFLTANGVGADAKNAKGTLKNLIQDADAYAWGMNNPGSGKTFGPSANTANPFYRKGSDLRSFRTANDMSKAVAAQQMKYNQQQEAINNILNKYIRGNK